MIPSYFPLNINLFYTVGILVGTSVSAKLLAWGLLTLYGLGIYAFCRKHFSRETGFMALLLLATVPLMMTLGWKTVVEPGIAFFELLAMIACFNWITKLEVRWVVLSGIFAGIALGSKYTFILQLPSLIILYLGVFRFQSGISVRKVVLSVSMFIAITVGVALVWFIKNYLQTGDPLYPMMMIARTQLHGNDPAPIAWSINTILLFPWKYSMGILQQETNTGPLFLCFLPLLFLHKVRDRKLQVLLVYFVLLFLPWVTVARGYQRFFLHGTGVASIILASYIVSLTSPMVKKSIIAAACVLGFSNILSALYLQKVSMDPLGYLMGKETASTYLSCMRMSYPNPYYPAYVWINHNTPSDCKVVILGEARGFYLQRQYLSSMAGSQHPFIAIVRSADTGEALYQLLNAGGMQYIVLNAPEVRRLSSYAMMPWQEKDISVLFDFFVHHTQEVYRFCGEVTLNNGQRGVENAAFWQSYSRDPLNSVYVYRIVPSVTVSRSTPKQFPVLLYPALYQEPIRSAIEKMIPSLEKRS